MGSKWMGINRNMIAMLVEVQTSNIRATDLSKGGRNTMRSLLKRGFVSHDNLGRYHLTEDGEYVLGCKKEK